MTDCFINVNWLLCKEAGHLWLRAEASSTRKLRLWSFWLKKGTIYIFESQFRRFLSVLQIKRYDHFLLLAETGYDLFLWDQNSRRYDYSTRPDYSTSAGPSKLTSRLVEVCSTALNGELRCEMNSLLLRGVHRERNNSLEVYSAKAHS